MPTRRAGEKWFDLNALGRKGQNPAGAEAIKISCRVKTLTAGTKIGLFILPENRYERLRFEYGLLIIKMAAGF